MPAPRIYYPGFFKESAIRSLQSSWECREGDVFLVSNFPVRGGRWRFACLLGGSWDVVSGPKTSQSLPVWLAPNVQVCSVFLPVWSKAWLSIKCQEVTEDKRWRRITTVEMWAGMGCRQVICKSYKVVYCVLGLSAFLGIATLIETMMIVYPRFCVFFCFLSFS